jgi:hypothetical protein
LFETSSLEYRCGLFCELRNRDPRQRRENPRRARAQVPQAETTPPDAYLRRKSLPRLPRSIRIEKFEDLHQQNVDWERQWQRFWRFEFWPKFVTIHLILREASFQPIKLISNRAQLQRVSTTVQSFRFRSEINAI